MITNILLAFLVCMVFAVVCELAAIFERMEDKHGENQRKNSAGQ